MRLGKIIFSSITISLILSSVTACGYKQFEDRLLRKIDRIGETKVNTDEIEQLNENDTICFESGGGKGYTVEYTIKKAVYYDSVEAAGLSKEDIVEIPMECVIDLRKGSSGWDNVKPDCGFIMFDVEVYNINYPGNGVDGSINVTCFSLMNEALDKDDVTYGSIGPSYFDKYPKGELATETNYYHLFLKMGEKTDIKLGTLVAASDIDAARKYSLTTVGLKKYDLSEFLEEGGDD